VVAGHVKDGRKPGPEEVERDFNGSDPMSDVAGDYEHVLGVLMVDLLEDKPVLPEVGVQV
jgi:hypothetical protein